MLLNVLTPTDNLVADLEVDEVIVPAYKGQLDILPGHSPLVSTLDVGVVKYRPKGSSDFESIVISWGYLEVNPKSVNILSETAEIPKKIDLSRASKAMSLAMEKLASSTLSIEDREKYARKLRRAQLRKDAAEGHA